MAESFKPHTVTPASYREFARVFGSAASGGRKLRIRGGATKLGWGSAPPAGAMHISTSRLTEASFTETTASFGTGTPLARAYAQLGKRGRLLALDPALGQGGSRRTPESPGATLGGVLATADSGPLSHAFGGARDQVIDLLAALPDGSLVRASEQQDLDLSSLLTGSYGTLAAILEVTVMTHPLPAATVTLLGTAASPVTLAAAAAAVSDSAAAPAAVDYAWHNGAGGLLVMLTAGADSEPVSTAQRLMSEAGLQSVEARTGADSLWGRQRAGQRSVDRAVLRVSGPRDQLPRLLELSDRSGATAIGRAARSCSYLTLDVNQIDTVRGALPDDCHATVTDLPGPARGAVDPWGPVDDGALMLMRELKQRFDPASACNPGVFIGGI
jgi:glycolate oxidase FAD binding subunit